MALCEFYPSNIKTLRQHVFNLTGREATAATYEILNSTKLRVCFTREELLGLVCQGPIKSAKERQCLQLLARHLNTTTEDYTVQTEDSWRQAINDSLTQQRDNLAITIEAQKASIDSKETELAELQTELRSFGANKTKSELHEQFQANKNDCSTLDAYVRQANKAKREKQQQVRACATALTQMREQLAANQKENETLKTALANLESLVYAPLFEEQVTPAIAQLCAFYVEAGVDTPDCLKLENLPAAIQGRVKAYLDETLEDDFSSSGLSSSGEEKEEEEEEASPTPATPPAKTEIDRNNDRAGYELGVQIALLNIARSILMNDYETSALLTYMNLLILAIATILYFSTPAPDNTMQHRGGTRPT